MERDVRVRKKVNRHMCAMQGGVVGCTGVIAAYAVILLQWKAFSATEIGIATALSSVAGIFLQPLVAAFSNRHPGLSLKTIMAGLEAIGLAAAVVLYFVSTPLVLVMALFIVSFVITASLNTFIGAFAMEFENRGMPVNFGIARGIGSICYALIGFGMGQLVEWLGPQSILPAYVVVMLATIVFTTRHITPEKAIPAPKQNQEEAPQARRVKTGELLRGRPELLLFFLALFCISYNHTALDSYQVNVIQELGGSTANYGTMMMIMGLCEIPSLFLCNRLMRRFGCGNMITLAMAVFLAKDIMLLAAGNVTLVYVAQICNLSTVGMYMPAMVYLINELVGAESNVSAQAFFVGIGTGLGRVLGNLAGGALIDAGGTHAMLIANIGVIAIGIVLMRGFLAGIHRKGLAIR